MCLVVWDEASLFQREGNPVVELMHPREHLVLDCPALHIMT